MVVVGSMDGCLYGFSEDDGHPMRLAFQNNGTSCEPVVKLDLLDRSKEEPYRATYTYQQLNGAGVEPSLAQSVVDEYGESVAFLVTGANYRTKGSKQPGGRLVAYRTTGRFNTFFERGSIQDADGNTLVSRDRENSFRLPEDQTYTTPAELELGNTYVVNATLGQEKLSADRLFTVWWFWTNQDQSAVRLLDTQYVKGGPGGFDSDLKVYYTPQPVRPVKAGLLASSTLARFSGSALLRQKRFSTCCTAKRSGVETPTSCLSIRRRRDGQLPPPGHHRRFGAGLG